MALQWLTGNAREHAALDESISVAVGNTQTRMLVVVAVRCGSTTATATVTDTEGNTYVRDQFSSGIARVELWHAIITLEQAPPGFGLTATFSALTVDRAIIVAVYEMAHQTAPFDVATNASNAGANTDISASPITTVGTGQGMAIAAFNVNARDQIWTAGPNYTIRAQAPGQDPMLAERPYTAGLVNDVASASTNVAYPKSVVVVAYKAHVQSPAVRAMHLTKQRNVWK